MDRKFLIRQFLALCHCKDYKAAIAFQDKIKDLIPGEPSNIEFKAICGLDVSFDKGSNRIFAAASVYSFPKLSLMEQKGISTHTEFPYIPGLLAFREGAAVIELLKQVESPIDLLLYDGQGIAHPRGAGLASMMGLLLGKPSIGCAKTRLIGEYKEPALKKGSSRALKEAGKIIGRVLRTRNNVKPVFVSVGYMIELIDAVNVVLGCCAGYRIPEPLRDAHILSNRLRAEKINI